MTISMMKTSEIDDDFEPFDGFDDFDNDADDIERHLEESERDSFQPSS